MDGRHDLDGDVGRQLCQRSAVVFADRDKQVSLGIDVSLPLTCAFRSGQRDAVARQLGAAPLTQVMHVDGIDDDACRRRKRADLRQILLGDVVEAEPGHVKASARQQQPQIDTESLDRVAGSAQTTRVERVYLDAEVSQFLGIALLPDSRAREERHMVALRDHDLQAAPQAQRAGLPIMCRKISVNDQHRQRVRRPLVLNAVEHMFGLSPAAAGT